MQPTSSIVVLEQQALRSARQPHDFDTWQFSVAVDGPAKLISSSSSSDGQSLGVLGPATRLTKACSRADTRHGSSMGGTVAGVAPDAVYEAVGLVFACSADRLLTVCSELVNKKYSGRLKVSAVFDNIQSGCSLTNIRGWWPQFDKYSKWPQFDNI